MDEKDSTAPVPKFARPCELGPTTRMPAARATSRMRRSPARPSSVPVSLKPEAITTHSFTPIRAHCSTAAMAAAPGTATMAASGTSGRASSDGKVGKPCVSVRLGLMPHTVPGNPCLPR